MGLENKKELNNNTKYRENYIRENKSNKKTISQWILLIYSIYNIVAGLISFMLSIVFIFTAFYLKYKKSALLESYVTIDAPFLSDFLFTNLVEYIVLIIIGFIGVRAVKSLAHVKALIMIVFVQFLAYVGESLLSIFVIKDFSFSTLVGLITYAIYYFVLIRVKKHHTEKQVNYGLKIKDRPLDDTIMWAVSIILVLFSVIVLLISSGKTFNILYSQYVDITKSVADLTAYYVDPSKPESISNESVRFQNLINIQDIDAMYIYRINPETEELECLMEVINSNVDENDDVNHFADIAYLERFRNIYNAFQDTTVNTDDRSFSNKRKKGSRYPYVSSFYAVRDENHDLVCAICVEKNIDDVSSVLISNITGIGLASSYIIIIVIILVSRFFNIQIVKPLRKISTEASKFTSSKNEMVVSEDLIKNKSTVNEINNLNHSVVLMERDIINYIDDLKDVTQKQQRIDTELYLAKRIQEETLPDSEALFIDREDIDIYSFMRPAKEIAGDFYDCFMIDDDHLALIIADVSGKGVPAALFMMISKIIINIKSEGKISPAKIFTEVNEVLVKNNKQLMFVTAWLGILELSSGKLVSANAGHEDPAICREEKEFILDKEKHGVPLGIRKKYQYVEKERQLISGDMIFLYTDGIPEATNSEQNMFGLDKMIEVLNEYKEMDAKDILKGVIEAVDEFAGEATQFDDITSLCFEYIGNKEPRD